MPQTVILCDGSRSNTHGFRIDVSGLDLERFRTNPAMLYEHTNRDLIGRWVNIRVDGNRLLAEPDFDMALPLAAQVAGQVERGYLRGCSMRVRVLEMAFDPENPGGYLATRTEVLEASMCAVQSDPGAVALLDANGRGVSLEELAKSFNLKYPEQMNENERSELMAKVAELEARVAGLNAQLAEKQNEAVSLYLDSVEAAGRLQPGERESLEKLAATNLEEVRRLIDARTPQKQVSLAQMGSTTPSTAPSGREGWNYLRYMKEAPEELAAIKRENPAEFERLCQTIKTR